MIGANPISRPDNDAQAAGWVQPELQTSRVAAVWLAVLAGLIVAMVVVGGATRVTGSGLSITQWKPVSGVIPPLSHAAWLRLFQLYQATPQYRLLNQGMGLAQFQGIFWWEWAHRLLGRLVGVAFLAPFVALLALRRLPRRLIWRCVFLFALGGLQGAVGWWMVTSGLETRTSVAPERLAAHLGLALLLFSGIVWTALDAWFGSREGPQRGASGWVWASATFLIAAFMQCLAGALVAGNHAGLIDADWPLMGGRLFPLDYWRTPLWGTLAHSLPAVQFNHRTLAYGLMAGGLAMAVAAWVGNSAGGSLRQLTLMLACLLSFQVVLGIATLVLTVPLPMALLHQFTAVVVLALATIIAWTASRM